MELKLIKKKEFPLLSRARASFWYSGGGATPSRKDLTEGVAKALKTKRENVIIKHIYPQYGVDGTKIIAHIYNDASKISEYEHKSLVGKHKVEEKKEEAPKASAEVPKEE